MNGQLDRRSAAIRDSVLAHLSGDDVFTDHSAAIKVAWMSMFSGTSLHLNNQQRRAVLHVEKAVAERIRPQRKQKVPHAL